MKVHVGNFNMWVGLSICLMPRADHLNLSVINSYTWCFVPAVGALYFYKLATCWLGMLLLA